MGENIEKINEFLDALFVYGPLWVYLIIFAACFIENIFPPFPGDSFIVGAGVLSGLGRVDWYLSFTLIVAGGLASVLLLYYLGKNKGHDYFIKKDFKYFSADDIRQMEQRFIKYGPLILILSRFIIGFRSALALVTGMSRYSLPKTVIFTVISYFLFGGLLFYGAAVTVENLTTVEKYFKTYNMIFWPLLIIALLLYIIWKVRKVRENLK